MIEKREEGIAGVVCLHCGLPTCISVSSSWMGSNRKSTEPRPPVSIIRCTECGGEAPYLADEIVMMRRVPNVASCAT